MSKIILYIAQSLDGFISTTDGGVAWLDQFNNTGDDLGYTNFIKSIDVNIQGANTYKQVLGFDIPYPYSGKTFVLTHSQLEKPKGADIEFFSGDLKELSSKAKEHSKKNVWLIGGASIVQQFLKESLIDEIILFTMPVLLGKGISLFGSDSVSSKVKLTKSKNYSSGIIESHYLVK
jgi:dihydrofolate reductase